MIIEFFGDQGDKLKINSFLVHKYIKHTAKFQFIMGGATGQVGQVLT